MKVRQALTGWIIAATGFVVAGVGAVFGAERMRGGEVPAEVVASWREYADQVMEGRRTPLPATTQLLTETAIAQNAFAASAVQLLRHRARLATAPPPDRPTSAG